MNLPNASKARVERKKVTDYLLCGTHPDGAGKADFFTAFGFTVPEWRKLADALRAHGRSQQVVAIVESAYGVRYTVEGPLNAADGRRPNVRTVWIVEQGSLAPRLVTAHPARRIAT